MVTGKGRGRVLGPLLALLLASCSSSTADPDAQLPPDAAGLLEMAQPLDGPRAPEGKLGDLAGPGPVPGTWIELKAGSFQMGSPASEPCRRSDEVQRQVTLTRAFEIAETETTQAEFRELMGYNPAFHASCGDSCPVEWVSWHEAAAFCNLLSARKAVAACYSCSGKAPAVTCQPLATSSCQGYRLPTEAEWEYAARAGTVSGLPNGEVSSCMTTDGKVDAIAWYKVNSNGVTHPVKGKAKNAWGLHDLAGNVYEWVHDLYEATPSSAAVTDPTGPTVGSARVFRGGAFYFNAEHARSARRYAYAPSKRFTFLGFRCVRAH